MAKQVLIGQLINYYGNSFSRGHTNFFSLFNMHSTSFRKISNSICNKIKNKNFLRILDPKSERKRAIMYGYKRCLGINYSITPPSRLLSLFRIPHPQKLLSLFQEDRNYWCTPRWISLKNFFSASPKIHQFHVLITTKISQNLNLIYL